MITAIPIDSCFYEERTSHISDLISMETKKKTKLLQILIHGLLMQKPGKKQEKPRILILNLQKK